MFRPIPILLKDFYKAGHPFQYVPGTEFVYSNGTARGSRWPGIQSHLQFGMQAFLKEFFIEEFNENFFARSRQDVVKTYKRRMDTALGPNAIPTYHIEALHELGYLPLRVKALPEGRLVPMRVPHYTIVNTRKEQYWLTNSVETLMSSELFGATTSATIAFEYRKNFEHYAEVTGGDRAFVPWQGHDFSMRGIRKVSAAIQSGAAHLLCFTGTDTIPAIDFLEYYYGANAETELIGGSVAATEHAVMSTGTAVLNGELPLLVWLITKAYPKNILSVVSDTWDFWNLVTQYLPALKDTIMAREGKLVIRPDSGDPVKILIGDPHASTQHERDGLIQTLWNIFGGATTTKGFKVLDPHIGAIYGDSITLGRQIEILDGLAAKGFASTNVVLGIGSFTYQYITRDSLGIATKATWAQHNGKAYPIFKAPKTDSGLKNSAKGLLYVGEQENEPGGREYYLRENVTPEDEAKGALQVVFEDGKLYNETTLAAIRSNVEMELKWRLAR